MRRFEFQEGSSNKFWEIDLQGAEFTLRWGKLGTTGQSQTKAFADAVKAGQEHDKLIREKTAKGYVESTAQATASPQPIQAAPAPVAPSPPPPLKAVGNGAVTWSEGLRRKILPWRGYGSKPTVDLKKVLARLQAVHDLRRAALDSASIDLDEGFRAALAQRIAAPLGQPPALQAEVEAAYLCLLGHNDHAWDRCHEIGADMVHLWCSQASPALAVRALVLNYPYMEDGQKTTKESRGLFPYVGAWRALRSHLAACDASQYAEALQAAQTAMLEGPLHLRRMLAVAFPDESEYVAQLARDSLQATPSFAELGVLASLSDAELFKQMAERLHGYLSNDFIGINVLEFLPTALARMETDAVEGLLVFANHASKTSDKRALAELLAQVDHPSVSHWFVSHKKDKAIAPIANLYLDRSTPPATPALASTASDLPPLFSNPPWLSPRPKKKLTPIVLALRDFPEVVHIPENTRRELLQRNKVCTPKQFQSWTQGFPENSPYLCFAERLCDLGQPEWAVQAWNTTDPKYWNIYSFRGEWDRTPERLLVTLGAQVLPGLLAIAPLAPDMTYPALAMVESPRVAATFAELRAGKKYRALAQKWFKSYPQAASVGLIPAALGGSAKACDALRWLAGQGHREAIMKTAAEYQAQDPVAEILDFDPLHDLPAKIPALPVWCKVERLEAPVLVAGGQLPGEAVRHLTTMLALSKLDAPYAGLDLVKEYCQPGSLERFAWSLYQAWLTAGGPAKEDWGFLVLAYFGGDQAARQLAPELRRWPGEGLSARAALGLEILGAIGTDVALMHLHALSMKVRHKALQDKAEAKIQAIAEGRGMSVEELADRLVPDLDLDENGSRQLGVYTVTFDEHLLPQLRDEQGKPVRDLPKSSPAEVLEAWKALKKDAKTVAATQLERLEQSLALRRRWSLDAFELLLVGHPLLGHLVRRLVWGTYRDDCLQATFRVAEDRSYADVNDQTFQPSGSIGLVHPLELDLTPWSGVFADYNILQPFAQIGRAVYRGPAGELTCFRDKVAQGGRILRLERRGWQRGEVESGCLLAFRKRLSQGEAVLELQEGGYLEELGRADVILGALQLPEGCHAIDVSEATADVELVLS